MNESCDRLFTVPTVALFLTDGCNSRCVMCDYWRNPKPKSMPRQVVDQIVSSLRCLEVRRVLLTGGETLLDHCWHETAQRVRAEGCEVCLMTNGLLLARQIDAAVAHADEVVVSLDAATAATYRAIRCVDAFQIVVEGIRAARAAGLRVKVRTTIQRANYAELPKIVDLAKAMDVTALTFQAVNVYAGPCFGDRWRPVSADSAGPCNAGGIRSHAALQQGDVSRLDTLLDEIIARNQAGFASGWIAESPAQLKQIAAYFDAVLGNRAFHRPRCDLPHRLVVIDVDGSLRPCFFLPQFGYLGDRTLAQAVNDAAAMALRRAYHRGNRPECERCVGARCSTPPPN